MAVIDLWKNYSKPEIAAARSKNLNRWQRRWRSDEINPSTGKPKQEKQGYKESQKAQAKLDDANHQANPTARSIRRSSVTVDTLLGRHLAAKADRAPKTVATDRYHANAVRDAFGNRHVSTLDATEIETWAQRQETARSSKKKQLEILRAAIKRAVRDELVDKDVTTDIVVSLGHQELPHWSLDELMAVVTAAPRELDKSVLMVLGLMGLRSGEAQSLRVRDLANGQLSVTNSGAGSDATKTRASRRVLPVPRAVLPDLRRQTKGKKQADYIFPSPRDEQIPVSSRYISDALLRAVRTANETRQEPIERLTIHGLRHTFAAISLSEAGGDILPVSRAMGHAKPSVTLDRYGHLAPAGLSPLMGQIDQLITENKRNN